MHPRSGVYVLISPHYSKGISYGIWHPTLGRTQVTVSRGIHFTTMGHSAPRSTIDESGVAKIHKRLELLPEEAVYLIERGALFCWKESDVDAAHLQGFEGIAGVPMSVQQAYAEMIGRENLTLEKFQVDSSLRDACFANTSQGLRLSSKTWICCDSE